MTKKKPTYLGDGLYAQWDGYHIILTVRPTVSVIEKSIMMDLFVAEDLAKYIKKKIALKQEERKVK